MSNNFELLNSNDDILLFDQHTFIVGRFRELCFEEVRRRIYLTQDKSMVIFNQLDRWLNISNGLSMYFNSRKWESMTEEIECKFLKIGDSCWRQGKLRMKNYVDFLPEEYRKYKYNYRSFQYRKDKIKIELEFSQI
ncbi:KGK domain-containing protein [Okeania sp.]|uniref:KGK domain-containing protein n=1 Tax=Okeania sp. TaxID=3100323 RepID=UPI002B4B56E3|nr:KGK domain-containing protein [Okeania sp.]MEB3341671.1 KGK domain-containing protein [Okeania sp.]